MGNNDLRPDVASSAPLVAIITPFYNTDPYLEECITSVLQQTYTNWKYISVDNCSTGRSVEIVERYAKQYPGKIFRYDNGELLSQVQNNPRERLMRKIRRRTRVGRLSRWPVRSYAGSRTSTAWRCY